MGKIGKLKTGFPMSSVGVYIDNDLGDPYGEGTNAIGVFSGGAPFPFSILKPGRIYLNEAYKDNVPVITHELRHAKDKQNPLMIRTRFMSRREKRYLLELRAHVDQIRCVPVGGYRNRLITWSAKRIAKIGGEKESKALRDLEDRAKDLGFDLHNDYRKADLQWK